MTKEYEIQEDLQRKHHARAIQTKCIVSDAQSNLNELMNTGEYGLRELSSFIQTPPIFVGKFWKDEEGKKSFFEKVDNGTRKLVEILVVNEILVELLKKTSEENFGYSEIDLHSDRLINQGVIVAIKKSRTETFPEYYKLGFSDGIRNILTLLSTPDKPLLSYRRDLVEKARDENKLSYEMAIDGGIICIFPTKVPYVSLKCYYPASGNKSSLPILSLKVSPFEQNYSL